MVRAIGYLEKTLKTWTDTFPNSKPEEVKEQLDKLTEENENLKKKLDQPSASDSLNNLLNEENKQIKEKIKKLEELLSERKQNLIEISLK